jgi:RecJ-like exonuclease
MSRPSSDPNAGSADKPSRDKPMSPGDDAPAGTPGTGENVCPRCGGSGRLQAGGPCPECDGTGKVTRGIGGG